MTALDIRKFLTLVETTKSEMGRPVDPPTRKAAALAVITNPFAGRDSEDLSTLIDIGDELGALLGQMAVTALGVAPSAIESFGKAAIVGEEGELEHAAAILHPKLGKPFRAAVEKGASLIPSAKKWADPALLSTSRWATRTQRSCAATSTPWRCGCRTRRAAARLSSPLW